MKKGLLVCLSVALAAVVGLFGGWLTFPMLFCENEGGDVLPAVSLANTPENNDVFTNAFLSDVSSVSYFRVGIHKDEAPLYIRTSQDAEEVLIALKSLGLQLENSTVVSEEQSDSVTVLYGGCSLTLYMKDGTTYVLTYGGSTVQLSHTVNGCVSRQTYQITSQDTLGEAVNQTFVLQS